ncbi:MAG TPA: methyltransferase [Pseudonocardiaceae bacterium]|nr:methyltransferase [Pseudonocardiaceae bacterium]
MALRNAGYDTAGVHALLGTQARDALSRGEPVPALRASADGGELGVLVRLFLLGEAEPAVAAALAPLVLDTAVACGLLRPDGPRLRAALDVRPHSDDNGDWWVVSDIEPAWRNELPAPDHVPGIGPASISLARAMIRRPVGTLLDLGTGCGIQALCAARHTGRITATDVAPRALALAEATFALNEVDVELLAGPWFEPVTGRRFDQVVSNPPFVVGPARVGHVYRDSGLSGDSASELLLRALPTHLTEGGTAQVLASWLHPDSGDWSERVASWLPAAGVDAWVVQRDVADPSLYVGTWLADSGLDPRSPRARAAAECWLDWFADQDAAGVGFGFVTMRRTDAQCSTVVCEDLRQPMADPLGPESAAWLDRVGWLRAQDDTALLDARLVRGADVVLDRTDVPGDEGWIPGRPLLRRRGGPGWRHETDQLGAALLAGCTGALTLGELLGLLSTAHDEPADPMVTAALPVIRELIRHGLLLPAAPVG